jgi:inorganic pyrophosphatase
MTLERLLKQSERFEIDVYKKPPHHTANHTPFVGSPRRHPYDENKIILIMEPFSSSIFYYEFFISDINGVEELPSLVTNDGESLTMARLWVRKGGVGVRAFPFLV